MEKKIMRCLKVETLFYLGIRTQKDVENYKTKEKNIELVHRAFGSVPVSSAD
jgi:hypothetical protein